MIYFIHDTCNLTIKIGYSDEPKARLAALQTANAHPLVILGTIPGGHEKERLLHLQFSARRLSGEWFDGQIIDDVQMLIQNGQEPRTLLEELCRRGNCRYGLEGLMVMVPIADRANWTIRHTRWGAKMRLLVTAHPVNGPQDQLCEFEAKDCILVSLWPIVCCDPKDFEVPL